MVGLRYLLDTDALSEPVKPRPRPRFMRELEASKDAVAISAITWHEAMYGLRRLPVGRRRSEIEEFLVDVVARSIPILPYDRAAADWHASERTRLEALGRTPPFVDGQIASVAHVHGLVLVTGNVSDYRPFEGIRIENWLV